MTRSRLWCIIGDSVGDGHRTRNPWHAVSLEALQLERFRFGTVLGVLCIRTHAALTLRKVRDCEGPLQGEPARAA